MHDGDVMNRHSATTRLSAARRAGWIAAVVASIICAAPASALALTPDEQRVLASLDQATITEAIRIVAEVKKLRDELAVLKTQAASAEEFLEGDAPERNLAAVVLDIAESLGKSVAVAPKLAEHLGDFKKIGSELAKAESAWKNARFDPEQYFDLDEATFRDEVKQLARDVAAKTLLDQFESETFARLDLLRNPAQYADAYIKGQFALWLSKPQEHELLDGLKFTIKPLNATTSVFDPAGGLTIEMEYAALDGAKLEATGMYFEFDPGKPIPKPNISKLQVRPNWQSLLPIGEISKLGGLSADLGLGFTLSDFELQPLDRPDQNKRRGGLKFKVSFKLWPELPKIEGHAIVYPADGELKWIDDVKGEFSLATPYPLGTTGAGLHGGSISFRPVPNQERFTFSTKISTAAPDTWRAVNLTVSLGVPIPVKELHISGTINAANDLLTIGEVEGKFDFARGKVTSGFNIPGKKNALPIGDFFSAAGNLEISGEGLHAEAKSKLFGQPIDETVIDIDSHGSGSISSKQDFKIPGLGGFDARLDASFTPGFKRLQVHAVARLTGVDLGFFNLADVAIEIDADTERGAAPITITARAWRASASVEIVNLADFDLEALLAELRKQAVDVIGQVAEELANAEKGVRESCRQAENDFRAEVHRTAEKYGIDRLSTNIPALNEKLGALSKAGKEATGKALAERDKLGKIAVQLRENPGQGVEAIVDKVFSAPEAWGLGKLVPQGGVVGNVVSGLLGGSGKKEEGPSQAEISKAKAEITETVLRAKVADKTEKLREAVATGGMRGITRSNSGEQKIVAGRRLSERSQLNLQFRNPSAALEGNDGALLTVVVPAAGFSEKIRTGKPTVRKTESDFQIATVRFERLVADPPKVDTAKTGEGKTEPTKTNQPKPPTAKISVPILKHGSQFPAERLAHVHLQELIERFLPEVEILGPKKYVESRLAVKNGTDEPLVLWVKTYHRQPIQGRLDWAWLPSAPKEVPAFRFALKPGETKVLDSADLLELRRDLTAAVPVGPLAAARVRLWAESESGERWMDYRNKDLNIVAADSALGGEPGYFADSMKTHVHVIRPKTGLRVHSERVVKLTNKTSEPLDVALEYHSVEGDVARWRKLDPFEVPPGATGLPTTPEGMKVRASQIRIVGKGENLYFGEYERSPLHVVDAEKGGRLYSAEKIGTFEFTFRPPSRPNTK